MKIIKLTSENIKKLKAVEIIPEDNMTIISGENAQGKSSILDSIIYALSGGKSIPDKVLRKGEEKGKISIELDDYIITRSFVKDNSYLKVENKDGSVFTKGQTILDELVGKLSFDPLEFAKKPKKEQLLILVNLLGISEELTKINNKYGKLFDERRFLKRELGEANAKIEDKPENFADDIPEKINVSEVSEFLEAERTKYQDIETNKRYITAEIEKISQVKDEIKDLEMTLKKCEEDLEDYKSDQDKLEKTFDIKKGKELKTKLENANEMNTKIDELVRYKVLIKDATDKQKKVSEIQNQIEENTNEKEEIIEKGKMPIEGLSFDEDGVYFNETPFGQLSSSEQIKVSMSIAIALNPKLRVILIKDGSLLDSKNMKIINDIVKNDNYQAFIEKVDETGEVGFFIEEGEIKKNNYN